MQLLAAVKSVEAEAIPAAWESSRRALSRGKNGATPRCQREWRRRNPPRPRTLDVRDSSLRWLLVVGGLVACSQPEAAGPALRAAVSSSPPVALSVASSSAGPSEALASASAAGPSEVLASASAAGPSEVLASASAAGPVTDPDNERLSAIYPGARALHRWQGRHAHSASFATVDSLDKVKAYYRRYARQHPGYEVSESPGGSLELDGGASLGVMSVRAAPAAPADDRLQSGERTIISSSRP